MYINDADRLNIHHWDFEVCQNCEILKTICNAIFFFTDKGCVCVDLSSRHIEDMVLVGHRRYLGRSLYVSDRIPTQYVLS